VPAPTPAAKPAAAAGVTKSAVPLDVVPPQAEATPPVNPSLQRAFDSARRALLAGRSDDAERGFLALVQSNPELGGPHANLGLIYRQAGKLKASASELEQAVRLSPAQPAYFNQLGITYRQQGRFAQARQAYESALALDPSNPAATLNLGILCDLYLRDSPCALAHYERYLALTPGGDATVAKWIADLNNRSKQQAMLSKKEKQ
jgi:Flp pilus assembly protein TadD